MVSLLDDPAFRALVEQAKRVCSKHPQLLPCYLAAVREKGKGVKADVLQAILDEVEAAVRKLQPESPGGLSRTLGHRGEA